MLEIAPPWVRTDLMNSREAEEAMPLDQFIAETMAELGTDADEIPVEGERPSGPVPARTSIALSTASTSRYRRASRLVEACMDDQRAVTGRLASAWAIRW